MKLHTFSSSAFVFILISGLYCQQTFANTAPVNINKGISDEEWKTIAGPKASETYSVVQGDTLWDISNRLFNDPRYWPKIWAMNNQNIKNPHKIYPGNTILFSPGSGSSLPSVAVKEDGTPTHAAAAGGNPENAKGETVLPDVHTSADTSYQINTSRSTEWQRLPKQNWENYQFGLPGNVDALGFDKRSKISFPKSSGFETIAIPASEKMLFLGEITGAKTESEYLGMGDTIYIKSVENIQIGNTYAITGDPALLKVSKTDRLGYSYLIMGKVKILSFRDKIYIGRILMVNDFVSRGLHLIPNPPRVPEMEPVPGVSPLRGALMIDHRFSTFTTAQYKEAFVNRGSEDGIKPGMIFRSYQHVDPSNDKKISNTDFVIEGDLMVTRVSENFSSVHVIRSSTPLSENSVLTLLTDVTDVTKNLGFNTRPGRDNVDEIDKLDRGEKVDSKSSQELKQLEDWKTNPPPGANGSDPSLPPPPGEEGENAPPPPPETPESMMTPPSAAGAGEETPPAPPKDAGAPEAGAQELGTPPVDGSTPAGAPTDAAADAAAAPAPAEAASAPLPPAPAADEAPPPAVESSAGVSGSENPAEEAAPAPPSATAVNPRAESIAPVQAPAQAPMSPPASAAEPPLPSAQPPAAQAPAATPPPPGPGIGDEPLPPPPPPSD